MTQLHRPAHVTAHPEQIDSITDAPDSPRDQFARRRRRYSTLMALRIPCLLLGASLYNIPWLAVTFIALSMPLPWMAVLIANDRPPRSRRRRLTRPAERTWSPAGRLVLADPEPGELPSRDR